MTIKAAFDPGAGLLSADGDNLDNTITTIRPFLGRTVMRKMPFGAVFLAALVAAGIPAAVAGPPTKTTLPFDVIMFDPCSGEYVELTGSQAISFALSTNANTYHGSLQISSHVDGMGQRTGARYSSNLEDKLEENGSFAGFPLELQVAQNVNFIGQGAVANERGKIAIRLIIDDNGTMTVNRDSVELTCPGDTSLHCRRNIGAGAVPRPFPSVQPRRALLNEKTSSPSV